MSDDPEAVPTDVPDTAALWAENQRLQGELDEARETLRAIRTGEVDAIVVAGQDGDQVFSLSGAESVYRLIFNTMQEAALTVAPDGMVLSCNPQVETLFKLTTGGAIGRPLEAFVALEERGEVARLLTRSQAEPIQQRVVFQTSDGSPVPAHVSAHAIQQPDGPCLVLVITNLTALEGSLETLQQIREQEAALRASEQRYRSLVELAPEAVLVHQEGRIVYVNAAALRLYGAEDTTQLIGTDVLHLVHPDERALVASRIQQVVAGQSAPTRPLRHRRLDGQEIPVETMAAPIDWQGVVAVQAIVRDVTERKQAEAALRLSEEKFAITFKSAPVGISIVSGTRGQYLDANDTLCQIFGYAREELLGRTGEDLHTFHRATDREQLLADVQQTGAVRGREVELVRKSGAVFPALLSLDRITVHGEPLFLGTVVDITARKQAETALQQAKDELEQRVQARTADLAQKARQLQALTTELTLAEQRERQRLAEHLHDGLQQLLVAAKLRVTLLPRVDPSGMVAWSHEVEHLLTDAIAASRTLTGELSPPILQTGGLVAGLEWLVRWKAEKYQLAVTLDADPEAVPDSEAMTLLLFQSVRELLFNIVKHAQVRAARVEVRRRDGHLQIVVSDQGVGFDPATLSVTSLGGLGFSSIRQRLEYLGGCVNIASAPGHGCRITLAAPLQSRASVSPIPVAIAPVDGRSAPSVARGQKTRILLVDDHAVVRQALAQMLWAEPDLEVVGEVGDGQAGVDLTKALSPDVVLMDINMPGMNGIEATQQIHADCPDVKVIGLSMFGAAEQTAAMQQAGAVGYVSKSAPAEELLAAIRASVAGNPAIGPARDVI